MSRAFTLVEVIVVVVILAIIAGVMAPRLGLGTREGAQAAERVRTVASALARRDALSPRLMALEGDATSVRLMRPADDRGSGGRDARGDAGWRADSLVAPAELGPLSVVAVTAGGVGLDERSWRIVVDPGFPRPHVVIVLEDARTGARHRVELAPRALEATLARTGAGDRAQPDASAHVDLDAAGGGDAAW